MAIRILEGSLPWVPALRASISRLLYAFETSVRMRSNGTVTLLLDDTDVMNNDEGNTFFLQWGLSRTHSDGKTRGMVPLIQRS